MRRPHQDACGTRGVNTVVSADQGDGEQSAALQGPGRRRGNARPEAGRHLVVTVSRKFMVSSPRICV